MDATDIEDAVFTLLSYFDIDSLNDNGPIENLSRVFAGARPNRWEHPGLDAPRYDRPKQLVQIIMDESVSAEICFMNRLSQIMSMIELIEGIDDNAVARIARWFHDKYAPNDKT